MSIIDDIMFWAKFLWTALRLVIALISIGIKLLVEIKKTKFLHVFGCVDDDECNNRCTVASSVAIQEMLAYVEKLSEEDFV